MRGFHNSHCVQLFKSLIDENEIRLFGIFLTNTYRKANAVYRLYKHLKSCHPNFIHKKLDRNYIVQRLYKKNRNPRQTLFDATSDLKKQLIEFITVQQLKKNDVHRNFLYLEALKERKLDSLFFRKSKRLQKDWDDDTIPGIEHFHNQYKLKKLTISHPNLNNANNLTTFRDIVDILDQYYYSAKIYSIIIYVINNQKIPVYNYYQDELTIKIAKKIKEGFETTSFPKKPKTKLLHKLLKAFLAGKIEDFNKIKASFFKLHYLFSQSEKHDILSILVAMYYAKRYETNVSKDLFEITKFSLKENLVIEDGIMESQFFINSIFIAKQNKDLAWIESFIKKYKSFLDPKNSKNTVLYAEAILLFEKKKFNEVLINLSQIQLNGSVMKAQIDCMNLQCFYELKQINSFDSLNNSSRRYLRYHKRDIPYRTFLMFKNFIKDVKVIDNERRKENLTGKFDKAKILKMLKRFSENKHAPYAKWLIEKIKEIAND